MEQQVGGLILNTPQNTFPLSTDSMLLSHFVRLGKQARVLDLGSGCATLGIALCAKSDTAQVTGVEIHRPSHEAALHNIQRNKLEGRLLSICTDLRTVAQHFPSGCFDICVSNPPYFSGGPVSRDNAQARHAQQCTPKELFDAAAWALRWGGDFYLVHKPEALGQLCGCGASSGLEPKHLCLIRHNPQKPISLILLQCRKGAKPGLQLTEQCLFDESGEPTAFYREAYRL